MSSLKSHGQVMVGFGNGFEPWNSGSQRICCSSLFHIVPEIVGSQERGVIEASKGKDSILRGCGQD